MKLHLVMVQALQAGDLEEADRCQQQLQVGERACAPGCKPGNCCAVPPAAVDAEPAAARQQ